MTKDSAPLGFLDTVVLQGMHYLNWDNEDDLCSRLPHYDVNGNKLYSIIITIQKALTCCIKLCN